MVWPTVTSEPEIQSTFVPLDGNPFGYRI